MKILALDIGGTAIKAGITDGTGKIFDLKEYETNAKNGGPYVMQKAIEIAKSYEDFEAIGISTTGQVDSKKGVIVYANENVPNYTGMDVKAIFENEFHVPVSVENDVNCAAIGETHYGAGRNHNDLLCITYGTGIGGAIIVNRQIYGGSKGLAGEFGHIITHPDGKLCACGQHGCYEQYASTTALVRAAKEYREDLTSGRIIFAEWQKGDEKIKEIVDNWIDEIVFGLVTLIHIFNPSALILGGGILSEPYVADGVNTRIYSKVMDSYSNFEIARAEMKNTAGLLGAAHIAYKNLNQ
ncbi:ROK family protein [Paludicola sp. MB14-C6]|uniref:ROK family protein n=1 Tax=Paludihabitans sp. MB14-C6 TaxID=3070656 RepID=UPI0027DCDE69|nr:ROK family protein [Paludicola sp. MB14-C6]WMJ23875.1 ROK family protein [Paludicola sp. MB14-C6]